MVDVARFPLAPANTLRALPSQKLAHDRRGYERPFVLQSVCLGINQIIEVARFLVAPAEILRVLAEPEGDYDMI